MEKPDWLFDRAQEWTALTAFADRGRPGLGVVRGRRRQGKSVLLRALSGQGGFFYHQALQGVAAEQRRDIAVSYARHHGGPVPAFDRWEDVIMSLLSVPSGLAIIDEVPYLTQASSELESVVQRAIDQAGPTGGSLILCGSAVTLMNGLLRGSAPLRGRAQMEVDVSSFDFRTAAAFSGLSPEVAFPVHAVVGGVPGYAVELLDQTFPEGAADVDRWLLEVAASPTRPLIHEARALLELEAGVRDPGVYHATLGAIAAGRTRTSEIASRLGRSSDQVSHALRTLADLGLVEAVQDLRRNGRPRWRIADPLLGFYSAVLRPNWAAVEQGDTDRLAAQALNAWRSQVLGPHWESLARSWTTTWAGPDTLGGSPDRVGMTVVNDPPNRTSHELDVVASREGRVLAIGEAKLRTMTDEDLGRLRAIRDLLPGAEQAKLLLFSASGFDRGLSASEAELVDLPRLYGGS
ncbi:AAA family ATPase [Euzebya tangerina]|uniref:AAA family ATPase n=1 Tax=Euzebya tangerina TaxID=591198 RepID=UPI0013C339C6|nr:ATP-binding protein [Euzebya tangerina]